MSTVRPTMNSPEAGGTYDEKSRSSPTGEDLKKSEDVEADVRSIHSEHVQHTALARGLKVSVH